MNLQPGDRVLVTGAGGFIGSAVTHRLLDRGLEVVALVEPGADTGNLEPVDVKQVVGDLREFASVQKAVSGCRATTSFLPVSISTTWLGGVVLT